MSGISQTGGDKAEHRRGDKAEHRRGTERKNAKDLVQIRVLNASTPKDPTGPTTLTKQWNERCSAGRNPGK